MNVWYAFLNALGIRMFEMDFMKNALLAVLLLGPLFGLLSTMIVTGKMSFFSDALGHSGFTGIAISVLCGAVQPIYFAVGLSVLFALLFSFVRSRTSQSADTIIGVFSSTAVALGIFIVTLGGRSFTKFNRYLIGDILSVSPQEIGLFFLLCAQRHDDDSACNPHPAHSCGHRLHWYSDSGRTLPPLCGFAHSCGRRSSDCLCVL